MELIHTNIHLGQKGRNFDMSPRKRLGFDLVDRTYHVQGFMHVKSSIWS